MKTPLQIGITGGIGSGKSLVCRIFSLLGVPVYDADSRAKNLMTTDGILIEGIRKEFGTLSYKADGTLNRDYLAQVFHDAEKLKMLNKLVHPRVAEDYRSWVRKQQSRYVIKEAALLFEAKSNQGLDQVIVVSSPEPLRIRRVLQRDTHRSEEQIRAIIRNQMREEEKLERADVVIYNDEEQLVIPQVLSLHQRFLQAE